MKTFKLWLLEAAAYLLVDGSEGRKRLKIKTYEADGVRVGGGNQDEGEGGGRDGGGTPPPGRRPIMPPRPLP